MSFFRKRSVAFVIAALVVLTTTPNGAKYSLERSSREVEELFYSGVEYGGYLHPSIYSQLQNRCDAANGLISLGRKYGLDAETEDLAAAREYMGYSSSPSGYYYNDCNLEEAFNALYTELEACELDERDRTGMEGYASTFRNAAGVIETAGYNEAVREFYHDVVYRFPAEYFYDTMYIDTPDYFGTMWY